MCKESPCVNGTCQNLLTNYTCTCNFGFEGRNCSQSKLLFYFFEIKSPVEFFVATSALPTMVWRRVLFCDKFINLSRIYLLSV